MQQHIDNKTKITRKLDSRSNVQIRKKNEESSRVQTHDYNPLENLTCKIGDNACAAKHVSVIQRAGLFHPMNESQKVHSLLRLQQQYGNRFVQRVIAQHTIQTKLQVGQPGDIYEQEADRVAEQVMRMSEPHLQRQVEPEEEEMEEELIQTKPIAAQITPLVQRQIEEEEGELLQTKSFSNHTPKVAPNLESRIHALKGGGQPLPESVRTFFEPRFGYDFSQVQVHTDTEASKTARAMNARAYTLGHDIVFGAGQYAPETAAGKQLLAHELTHVVQQLSRRIVPSLQLYPVPGRLKCNELTNWLDKNSPYKPSWGNTKYKYRLPKKWYVAKFTKTTGGISGKATGKSRARVKMRVSTDMPRWNPTKRRKRRAELKAWRRMLAQLRLHENEHKRIVQRWRDIIQYRARNLRFTVRGSNKKDAEKKVDNKVMKETAQWFKDHKTDQAAFDKLTNYGRKAAGGFPAIEIICP